MRVEGDKEFRIYCEDVEGCAIGVLTEGVLSLSGEFDEPCPRDDATEERESLPDNVIANATELRVRFKFMEEIAPSSTGNCIGS
jgi:hypothetical protein